MAEFSIGDAVEIADDTQVGEDGLRKGTPGEVKLVAAPLGSAVPLYLVGFGNTEAWLENWEIRRA